MNRSDLKIKILALEGLSDADKSALLGLLHEHKKYGLVWEDKPEDVGKKLETGLPVLREVTDRAILSDNPDAPNHILIEGDNLEALTALSYTHAGKIDVIYIDPPYNTGNKDFIYNDKYIDSNDEYRHSKWLSFMSKRLRIAKRLLSEQGAIFISIDENEHAQVKLLCDEIFSGNYIGEFSWQKRKGGGNDSAYIAVDHEYVVVYAKSTATLDKQWRVPYEKEYLKRYNKSDEHGPYYYDTLSRPGLNNPIIYDVICPDGSIIKDGTWQVSKNTFEAELKIGNIDFIKNKQGGYTVVHKVRIPETGRVIRSIINDISNKDAADEMLAIMGDKKAFSNPKPSLLIYKLIQLASKRDSCVLDFFAGSGTTLHATMQLNAEDGGKRKCILVTNNENGICENVTYERNRRVIQGYSTPKGEEVAGLTDNNLRYYRTEFVEREPSVKNMKELVKAATGLLCARNDLYTEVPFGGRELNPNVARYFEHGDKRMIMIYNEQAIPFIVNIIKTLPEDEIIKVYVFAYGSDPYEADFVDVKDRVTLCALPDAIYNAYRKVLPKRKPTFSPDELVEEIIHEVEPDETPDGSLDFDNGYNQKGGDR